MRNLDQVVRGKLYISSKDFYPGSFNDSKVKTGIKNLRKELRERFKELYPNKDGVEREWYLDCDNPTRKLRDYRDCFESCYFMYEIRARENGEKL